MKEINNNEYALWLLFFPLEAKPVCPHQSFKGNKTLNVANASPTNGLYYGKTAKEQATSPNDQPILEAEMQPLWAAIVLIIELCRKDQTPVVNVYLPGQCLVWTDLRRELRLNPVRPAFAYYCAKGAPQRVPPAIAGVPAVAFFDNLIYIGYNCNSIKQNNT
jgi:hypothetical protein